MAKRDAKSAPPRALLWLGGAGAVAAILYAFWSTAPTPAPRTNVTAGVPAPVPMMDDPPPGASPDLLVSTGNARMDAGAYPSAIKYYTRALELDSTLTAVWVDRGACLHAQGDERSARADFQRALTLDPVHVIAHFNMGVAYMTDGAPDSARAWWNRLLLLSPSGMHADRARALLGHLDSLESTQNP